jgi:hypothetical protein
MIPVLVMESTSTLRAIPQACRPHLATEAEPGAELRPTNRIGVHHLGGDRPAGGGPSEEGPAHAADALTSEEPVVPDRARILQLQSCRNSPPDVRVAHPAVEQGGLLGRTGQPSARRAA